MSREVDTLERFDFGGPAQWALVRGQSRKSPVLLLMQAGPGLPLIHEARAFERRLGLEEKFRVVYWDQRGTGKSFDAADRGTLTLERLTGDFRAMLRALSERLAVRELDVAGFSLGATVALLGCAEDPAHVRSLTCVGPDVNWLAAEQYAHAFALAEAERRGHAHALRALQSIGEPPHAEPKRFTTRAQWVANFGGVERGKNFGALLFRTLMRLCLSPHYTLREKLGALKGLQVMQERVLPALQGLDLLTKPPAAHVPIAIFQGRHDVAGPPALAAGLAAALPAELVWFEDSAHSPHEEEPVRFRDELLRFVARVSKS